MTFLSVWVSCDRIYTWPYEDISISMTNDPFLKVQWTQLMWSTIVLSYRHKTVIKSCQCNFYQVASFLKPHYSKGHCVELYKMQLFWYISLGRANFSFRESSFIDLITTPCRPLLWLEQSRTCMESIFIIGTWNIVSWKIQYHYYPKYQYFLACYHFIFEDW